MGPKSGEIWFLPLETKKTAFFARALFFGPCHCSYIFVPCLVFRVRVAGDLNKTIAFLVGFLSTSFARVLLVLIH